MAADQLEPVPSLLALESAPLNRREDRRGGAARAAAQGCPGDSCSLHLVGDVHPRMMTSIATMHAAIAGYSVAAYLDGELCAVRPEDITSFSMIQAPSEAATLPRSSFPARCFTANHFLFTRATPKDPEEAANGGCGPLPFASR